MFVILLFMPFFVVFLLSFSHLAALVPLLVFFFHFLVPLLVFLFHLLVHLLADMIFFRFFTGGGR